MISSIFTFTRLARQTLRGGDSVPAMAAGVTFGMLIGLIPSDSLVVAVLAMLAMATRTNLFVAACSTILFSWIGSSADTLLHRVGALVLTHPELQASFAWAAEAPILPWTRFNNTIACGAMCLGICLIYPTYYLSHAFFDRVTPIIHRRLVAYRLYRTLAGIAPPPAVDETAATQTAAAQTATVAAPEVAS